MFETICKDCGARYQLGTDHACKRPAKKSTETAKSGSAIKMVGTRSPTKVSLASVLSPLGPVDTHYGLAGPANAQGAETANTKPAPKLGRPRIHPDRKAYKAEHGRQRRANKKAKEAEMAEYDKALSKAKHDGTEAEFRAANMAAYDSIKAKEMK